MASLMLYTKDDYSWDHREDEKEYLVMQHDNVLKLAIAKDKKFYVDDEDITDKIIGFTDKERIEISLGFNGEKIKNYKLGG